MTDSAAKRALQQFAQSPNNHCFACGPGNPHGLHLHPAPEGDCVVATFIPGEWHEGWQGVVHGGILTTILDETMAYVLFHAGYEAVTARMDMRYRAPAQRGDRLRVEARMIRHKGRVMDIEGKILRDGNVIVEGTARFMIIRELDPEAWQASMGVG